jgi:2-isopropylmalate synthase
MGRIPNAGKAIWSTHCHNDLGMAVANSLAAVVAGARQVECTINGLGERAGNASLEEIVMAVRTRSDVFKLSSRIDATQIVPASKLVSTITGYPVQPNKAVVGANAFAHESGIHQDGVLKHRETYEIMRAADVGWDANRLSLGKLSGRSAFKSRLPSWASPWSPTRRSTRPSPEFKELADKKREIFDERHPGAHVGRGGDADEEHYALVASRRIGNRRRRTRAWSSPRKDANAARRRAATARWIATFQAIESLVAERRGADALLGEQHHAGLGFAGRGDRAPVQERARS